MRSSRRASTLACRRRRRCSSTGASTCCPSACSSCSGRSRTRWSGSRTAHSSTTAAMAARRRAEGAEDAPARPVPRGRGVTRKGSGIPGAPVERGAARQSIDHGGATYSLLEVSPELLVALQERSPGLLDDARSLATSRVVLAGDLSVFPPADLLNFLH